MKKFIFILFFIHLTFLAQGQTMDGRFISDQLYSAALENIGGEEPTRRISVYLPPDYDISIDKYPVVYYLHGITQSDSSLIA